MKMLIAQAIDEHRMLRMIYEGRRRITVEPYVLGQTPAGQEALLCRQVAPPAPRGADWRMFHLGQVRSLQMLGDRFDFSSGARHLLLGRFPEITAMV